MPDADIRGEGDAPGLGKLIFWMLALVVVGAPMVYVLWEALNALLSGHPERIRMTVVLPVVAVFAIFVYFLARVVRRWDASEEES